MNKIFKIIWSKARNCYVVVSEIAHCRGKGQGQKKAVFTCSLAAALAVFTLTGGITTVQAAQTINITEENPGAPNSTNQGKNSIVIGPDAKNESNRSDGLIVIGHSATVNNNEEPEDSIAIGTRANAVGENNIAIGTGAAVTNNGGNNTISLGTGATAAKSKSIAIGMEAQANNNDGIAAIAIGSGAEARKDKSIAIGYKALAENAGESGGIAIGSSIVDSQGKIITQTTAAQGNDIAFGVGAQTINRNMNGHNGGAIAIGHLSYSNGNQDVAIGDNAKTGRDGNNAGSPKRWDDGEGYVAIGANSFSNVGPGVIGYDPSEVKTKESGAVWVSTNGAVSVGNVSGDDSTKWITRQITGVAAGSADTDAVNVAQLKQAIAQSGGSSGGNSNHSTVTVGKNGVSGDNGTVQGGNLTLTKTTNGASNYDLRLNKNIDLGNEGSVKTGNTTINNGGVTITTKNGDNTNIVSLTENGLNNGGKTITNVEKGTYPTDAVNVSQLNAAKTTVKSSDNSISVTADSNGTPNYAYDIKVATATLSNGADGKVSATNLNGNENSYATGNSVANAINNSGFTLTTSNSDGGSVSGTSTPLIKPGSTVTLDAGKNIALTQAGSKVTIALNKDINLNQNGSLTVGGNTQDGSTTGQDPIVIKHFDAGKLTVIGTDKDGNKPQSAAGDYVTGLDNKEWNVNNPKYVSGRAATEDQLKAISDTIKSNADTAAGQHTEITVNDKKAPTIVPSDKVGTTDYGDYVGGNDNLLIAAKKDTTSGKTIYNIKLNDQLTIGQKGEPGKPGTPGKDGKFTVETSKGTTVVIGHDGEPGKDGKDGISVKDKDGNDGVTISAVNGKDGTEGHIGLTGPKGDNGKNADIDISTVLGKATLDRNQNEVKDKDDGSKDQAALIQYQTTVKDDDGTPRTITHEVATMDDGMKYAGDFGDGASVKLNKTVNIKGNVAKDKTKDDFVDGNIAVVANQNGEDGELLIKLNKDLTGLNSATYKTSIKNGDVTTMSTTVVDGTGLKITKGPSITNTGIDGGSKKITNVAEGEISAGSKEAINGSQLYKLSQTAGAHSTVSVGKTTATENNKEVKGGNLKLTRTQNGDQSYNYDVSLNNTLDLSKDGSLTIGNTVLNNAGLQIGSGTTGITIQTGTVNFGGNVIHNVAPGSASSDVATVGQLTQVEAGSANVTVKNIGTTSAPKYKVSVTNAIDPNDPNYGSIKVQGNDMDASYKNNNYGSTTQQYKNEYNIRQGADYSLHILGGYDLKGRITTDVAIQKKAALRRSRMMSLMALPTAAAAAVDTNFTNVDVAAYEAKYLSDKNLYVALDQTSDGVTGGLRLMMAKNPEFNEGTSANQAAVMSQVPYLKAGDNVNFTTSTNEKGQTVYTINAKVSGSSSDSNSDWHLVPAGGDDGYKVDASGKVTLKVQNGENIAQQKDVTISNIATKDDLKNLKVEGKTSTFNVTANGKDSTTIEDKHTVNFKDGQNITATATTTDSGVDVQFDLKKDISVSSVTTDSMTAKTVTTDTLKVQNVTIDKNGIDAGGNKVTGVATGTVSKDSTDAVNGSQLWQRDQAINGLSGSVNKLGNRINRVGAGAAALAALHPLDFDPDDKWDFAAGYGKYRGANAAAIGAYYRPNEDTMFSVGGSFGGGENMVNSGVSIKLGQGNHVSTSRVAMAKEMKAMRQHMAEQDALIAKLQSMHGMAVDPAKSVLFPDVAENHWAYQYVTTLAKKGILEGYPDGEFKGDRMMTRYEFAAIVYRIVESGVGSTDPELSKLVKEFSPELQYIRIDTIQKDRNGKPTIERVRVISDAK